MNTPNKFKQLFTNDRDIKEIDRWLLSLAPLGVAFTFFVVFLLPLEIPNKDVVLTLGITSGFIGLQTYWVIRGWRRNEGMTVLLGILSMILVVALAWGYMQL